MTRYLPNFTTRLLLVLFYCLANKLEMPAASPLLFPGQPPFRYTREGDVIIGGILSGFGYNVSGLCNRTLFTDSSFHFSEGVVHAIERVNRNSSILPGVTLGFAILDDCMKENTAAVQAMTFVKRAGKSLQILARNDNNNSSSSDNNNSNTFCRFDLNASTITNAEFGVNHTSCFVASQDVCPAQYAGSSDKPEGDELPVYDVIGVIGALRSSSSQAASLVLGPAQIPLISFASTSEELSHKALYPYFMRVIPSDNYLVKAIVELIRQLGWSYVSVLYAEGSFGELAYSALREDIGKIDGVCIAYAQKIFQDASYKDHQWILQELAGHNQARVVIAFTDPPSVKRLLRASHEQGTSGWFIWLGNDSWKVALGGVKEELYIRSVAGSLVSGFQALVSPAYNQHVHQMNPRNNRNPWFLHDWEETFNCSITDPDCVQNNDVMSLVGVSTYPYADIAYTAVLTYAHALERVLQNQCPNATGHDVRECMRGTDFLSYLRNSSFYGPSGLVEFDDTGTVLSELTFEQIIPGKEYKSMSIVPVLVYDARTSHVTQVRNFTFHYLSPGPEIDDIPESVCSKPCEPGEFVIQKYPECCWECRRCRNNEILVDDFTDCLPCPEATWPDPESNFTVCETISPEFPSLSEPLVILCLVLALMGVLGVALVTLAYVKHRDVRVIKASSKELSFLQLGAILTAQSSPIEALRAETGVPSIESTINANCPQINRGGPANEQRPPPTNGGNGTSAQTPIETRRFPKKGRRRQQKEPTSVQLREAHHLLRNQAVGTGNQPRHRFPPPVRHELKE
ncbi:metabotropic glutamate receptor 6 [Aplysia californica]|uniref:Metabotropic glutamate receptor 6 n=1 Tax=Aplysia californica TaxID=6500 RepID=A0ABM1VX62_APLCA|nr:metabotropic glutamate receptor 6 [Aplysia californica]